MQRAQQLRHMAAHRVLRDAQAEGDALVRLAQRQARQDLALARRQQHRRWRSALHIGSGAARQQAQHHLAQPARIVSLGHEIGRTHLQRGITHRVGVVA